MIAVQIMTCVHGYLSEGCVYWEIKCAYLLQVSLFGSFFLYKKKKKINNKQVGGNFSIYKISILIQMFHWEFLFKFNEHAGKCFEK